MEDISLHILDVAQNSVAAGATLISIRIADNPESDSFVLEVEDNGRGIPRDVLRKVLDPFYTTRTTRNVGLGLSLLAQSARDTGGDISVKSEEGRGATVTARFRPSHIDMKPIGDIASSLLTLIAGNPSLDFFFSYEKAGARFEFDTEGIKKVLEEVPLTSPYVLSWLKDELKWSLRAVTSGEGRRRKSGR
jgi:hypothetical protein